MRLKTAIAGAILMAAAGAEAHDFTVTTDDGQRLYFDITNKNKRTAAVTYSGRISDKKDNGLTGKVEIPSKVKHNNVVYDITAINPKAFAGSSRLKGIVIPSGVESIGDFAFEGCDSLLSVVFPGNPVTLGQGVFFRCTAISDVTIGSDWKTIDLSMFRWSDNLTKINIPAKTDRIRGVKKLKKLTEITVDPNNETFAAHDGMLYSKDGKTLYACPRAYAGQLIIQGGTETVTPGAFIDCPGITAIDFPESLKSVSFRETSRMKKLRTIQMRGAEPVMTAWIGGTGRLLFQLADNCTPSIMILSASKEAYEAALAGEPGEYSETPEGVPYVVTAQQMPARTALKPVKNFDN